MSTPLQVLVDGDHCSAGWPMDRGLAYGDGLFETMLARAGHIRLEELHAARLALGLQCLQIEVDQRRVWADVHRLAARHRDATLRLQVTRGDAMARGYTPTGAECARTIVAAFEPPSATEIPAHRKAITLRQVLGENPALAGLKHCNRLEQVLARQAMRGSGAFEGVMASSSGRLVSGTMSNVFLELDGELVTPDLDRCGVAGVLRGALLRDAPGWGFPVKVATLPMDALARCTALAFSNARMGLQPVHTIDGRGLPADSPLHALSARLEAAWP